MLPSIRRLSELVSAGLFSLIAFRAVNRGWPVNTRNTMRVLYAAVREVASRVMERAQAFV